MVKVKELKFLIQLSFLIGKVDFVFDYTFLKVLNETDDQLNQVRN
jgi:hypothetical protein